MSIITPGDNGGTLTPAQQAAKQITTLINTLYKQMISIDGRCMDIYWRNRFGATPQQIADVFATDATELFEFHAELQTLVNGIAANSIPDDPTAALYTVVPNSDGTATITPLPTSSSSSDYPFVTPQSSSSSSSTTSSSSSSSV